METLATYTDATNPKIRARIVPDYDTTSPREWDNTCLFHFKDDRDYKLPQEADDIIDWQYHEPDSKYDNEEFKQEKKEYFTKLNEEYYIFGMYYNSYSCAGSLLFKECYVHDEKMIGLALVKKGVTELTGYNCTSEEDAHRIFEGEFENFKQWNEGETFGIIIEEPQTWTNEKGETKEEWENTDFCYGFYGSTYKEYKDALELNFSFNFNLTTPQK